MRKLYGVAIGLAGVALGAGLALAATDYGALKGRYSFYSGSLTERGDPSPKDTKLLIHIEEPVAGNIFNRMGKAARVENVCGGDEEWRHRGPLQCTRYEDGARCSMVFDLRSGEVSGLPC